MNDQVDGQAISEGHARPSLTRAHGARGPAAWLAGIVSVAIVLGAVAIWWHFSATTPIQYATADVSQGSVTQSVTATGTVNPVLTIIVGAEESGVIQQIFCDYNTQVKVGQICA